MNGVKTYAIPQQGEAGADTHTFHVAASPGTALRELRAAERAAQRAEDTRTGAVLCSQDSSPSHIIQSRTPAYILRYSATDQNKYV